MQPLWRANTDLTDRAPLNGDFKTEVAIVGAGMAGLLIAYLLQKRGIRCLVIEKDRIAGGVTEGTTAKISIQHHLIYDRLLRELGTEKALKYASMNQMAVDKFRDIVRCEGIDCHFEKQPSYVFSRRNVEPLIREVRAARSLGIDASFVAETDLPFPAKGAVKFSDQAQFHPLEFIKAISSSLEIVERTRALQIDEHRVKTDRGIVTADYVVVATHFPIRDVPGYYFLRMYQSRSYVIALKGLPKLEGMYIDEDSNGISLRNALGVLLVGGKGHRTGKSGANNGFEPLIEQAKGYFGSVDVAFQWSAQDCITLDGIPYIGRYSKKMPHLLVATGFNKWGMTGAMNSAILLVDEIMGSPNACAEVFSPQRFDVRASYKNLFKNAVESFISLSRQKLYQPIRTEKKLQPEAGQIVRQKGKKAGVYRDECGQTFCVHTKCPHLGCEVHFNQSELTWECPCHGSRFDKEGNVIDGPSMGGIKWE